MFDSVCAVRPVLIGQFARALAETMPLLTPAQPRPAEHPRVLDLHAAVHHDGKALAASATPRRPR